MTTNAEAGRVTTSHLRDISVAPLLYYTAFAIYSFCCLLDRTTFEEAMGINVETFDSAVQVVVLALLVSKFLTQRASFKGWITSAIVVLVGYISWRSAGEGWLFWVALFVVCSDSIDLRTLATITFVMLSVMIPLTLLCGATGIIENRVSLRGAGVVRQAMGFGHPNFLGNYLLLLCVSFSTLRFGKKPLPDIVLILITILINLILCDSRSSAALSFVQIVLLLVFYNTKTSNGRHLLSVAFVVVLICVITFSYSTMVGYDASNPLLSSLNSAMTGRLSYSHAYYSMQPLTFFGSDFEGLPIIYWEEGEPYSFVVDNAYCHLLLRYGIVPTALFLVGLFALIIKLVRADRWDSLLFGLMIMSIYGIGETLGIRIECDFFLVAMGSELLFMQKEMLQKAIAHATPVFVGRGGA